MRVLGLAFAGGGCSDCSEHGTCGFVGIEFGTRQSGHGARHHSSMGRVRLGLAPGARSLELLARGMGSAALRAEPVRRRLGCLWGVERSLLWRLGYLPGGAGPLV